MDENNESCAVVVGITATIAGGSGELLSTTTAKEEKARLAKAKRKMHLLREMSITSKRGVCYLSHIPPQMDPAKLRQMLSLHGEVLRIYLMPEEPAARMRRKSAGGHCGQRFSEGWVEFAKKSIAKKVAHMLNGEQIGGKKRTKFYYDLWNIKYLSGFKWDHLTDEQARKNADREQKLVLEISAAKKERDFYLAKIDQSRALSAMQERAKKKQRVLEDSTEANDVAGAQETRVIRRFSQVPPVSDRATKAGSPKLSQDFLSGIFGKFIS